MRIVYEYVCFSKSLVNALYRVLPKRALRELQGRESYERNSRWRLIREIAVRN